MGQIDSSDLWHINCFESDAAPSLGRPSPTGAANKVGGLLIWDTHIYHRAYAARPSIAFRPAVVIVTRATSICRSPAFMGLRCAPVSPSRINSPHMPTLTPSARKDAPVQPC